MSACNISHHALGAALIAVSWIVTACDMSGTSPGVADQAGAEQAEGQANVEAMAQEHAKDTSDPSEAAQIAPGRSVISEFLPYAEVNEKLVYGHFVFPSNMIEPLPAIIVIHEWWGLNDNVRAMANRLAAEGYIVLAIDLFGGKVAANPSEARQLMISVVEHPDLAADNIRQAYIFVDDTAGAPSIGSLGWCFGGGWSLNTAMLFPDKLDASVIYYGQVTEDEDKLRPISAPILGLFAAEDRGIRIESVRAFEQSLERLRKKYEIHIYPDVGHAFANPTGRNYNAEAAEDAWQKTLEFLSQNLSPDAS